LVLTNDQTQNSRQQNTHKNANPKIECDASLDFKKTRKTTGTTQCALYNKTYKPDNYLLQ